MKALKVLVSIFLGIIMFISVLLFGTITMVRTALSGDSIGRMIETAAKETDKIDLEDFFSNGGSVSTDELNKALDEMEEYVSREEVYEGVGDLANQLLKYYMGTVDEIDTTKVKKAVKKVAKKYEEKTGEKINIDDVEKEIDRVADEAKTELKQMSRDDRDKLELLGNIYNNGIYFGILGVFIVCAVLIVLINKSVTPLLIHLIIISIINAITNGILFIAFRFVPIENDEVSKIILSKIGNVFRNMAIFSAIAFVVFVILVIIVDKNKHKKPITT